MKYAKEYQEMIAEAAFGSKGSKLHGYRLTPTDYETELTPEFDDTKTYIVETGDDDIDGIGLFLAIYDGKLFSLLFDSVPVPTSLHSGAEKNEIYQASVEIPKPMAKLTAPVLKATISEIKRNYT